MFVTLLAWRNLWRNRRRTLLAAGAIAFMTFLVVFVAAIQYGTFGQMIDFATRQIHGHLQLQQRDYFEQPGLRHNIEDSAALAAQLRAMPEVTVVGRRAIGHFVVSADEQARVAQVFAVEPEQETQLSSLPDAISIGRYLQSPTTSAEPGGAPAEAVLGAELARLLGAQVGSELVLMGSDESGSAVFFIVEVVGLLNIAQHAFSATAMFVPLPAFANEMDFADKAHQIVVQLDDLESAPSLAAKLDLELGAVLGSDVGAYAWDQLIPDVVSMMEMKLQSQKYFFVILIVMVTMSIGNTFMMTIFERTREFGVLIAIGLKPWSVVAAVQLEALFLCTLGVGIGIGLATIVVSLTAEAGISMGEQLGDALTQMSAPERIFPAHQWWFLPIAAGSMILATQIAALIPGLRLLRLDPVVAIAEEK